MGKRQPSPPPPVKPSLPRGLLSAPALGGGELWLWVWTQVSVSFQVGCECRPMWLCRIYGGDPEPRKLG